MHPKINPVLLGDTMEPRRGTFITKVDLRNGTPGEFLGPNANRSALIITLATVDTAVTGYATVTIAPREIPAIMVGINLMVGAQNDATGAANCGFGPPPLILNRSWFGDDLLGAWYWRSSVSGLNSVFMNVIEISHMQGEQK